MIIIWVIKISKLWCGQLSLEWNELSLRIKLLFEHKEMYLQIKYKIKKLFHLNIFLCTMIKMGHEWLNYVYKWLIKLE